MMLKLKLQYFGHVMRRVDSLEDSDAGRDWGQEEKGTTEDEMAVWHHWLDGRASEWTPGVGDGQRGLACCDSWGRKELDMTEQLNWTELLYKIVLVCAIHQYELAIGIHMSPPSWIPLPSPTSSHPSRLSRALGWALYVTQQTPAGYLFSIWQCIYFHAAVSVHPTLSLPHCVHKSASPLLPCK